MHTKKVAKNTLFKSVIIILVLIIIILISDKLEISLSNVNNFWEKYTGVIGFAQIILVSSTVCSLLLVFHQLRCDHEKARREKTVELLLAWSNSLTRETHTIKKVVEKFNEEQCRKLFAEEEFEMDCQQYTEIVESLTDKPKEKEEKCGDCEGTKGECNRLLTLNKRYIKKLRYSVISYLNTLEAILVSWQYSIVDRDIIEQQFSFLVNPRDGNTVLENFRKVVGSEECYPAIEAFCSHLEEKRKDKIKEKGKIA